VKRKNYKKNTPFGVRLMTKFIFGRCHSESLLEESHVFNKDEIPQFRIQIYLFANAYINLVLIANDLPLFFRKTPEK